MWLLSLTLFVIGSEGMDLAGREVLDLALALDHVIGLHMVLVPEGLHGPRLDGGLGEGEAGAVLGQKKAPAGPDIAVDVPVGSEEVFEAGDDHGGLRSQVVRATTGFTGEGGAVKREC